MESIYNYGVAFFDSVRDESDPRTRKMFMVYDTPVYVWMCSVIYLAIVIIGPYVMQSRKPFQLRGLMMMYNAFLVALSIYMVFELWYSAYRLNYNLMCQPFDPKINHKIPGEDRMANALWWYFFSKLVEFLDTIFMVLRKKNDQITFLHVFHHVSMLNIWWFSVMLIPGGQSWFSASLNSLVHVFMYSYYFLNLFPSIRKYLWWKRYITRMQLTQFVIILLNTSYVYFSGCAFPTWSTVMLISYMFLMLLLFGNFYIHAYIKGKRLTPKHHVEQNGSHVDDNMIKID